MSNPLHASESFARDLAASVRAFKDRTRESLDGEQTRPRTPLPIVVCLHEELESGGTAQAERLKRERDREVQDVMVIGYPDVDVDETGAIVGEPPTFTLRFGRDLDEEGEGEGEPIGDPLPESEMIPVNATAQQFLSALAPWPENLRRLVRVITLGEDLMRWRVSLRKRPDDDRWPLIEVGNDFALGEHATVVVQRNLFIGTGITLPVHSIVPTGDPTPLKVGAQCVAVPYAGGYGIIAGECRKFSIEEPDEEGL